jgi:MoaA/NifB/PqqE/SkfB family radical SAM enzyme
MCCESKCLDMTGIALNHDIESLIDLERVFGYNGGTFSNDQVQFSLTSNIPLTLDLAIPGRCLNRCLYCGYYDVNKANKLSFKEITQIIKNFKSIGGKSIKILGEGEPLLRTDIFTIIEEIFNNDLIPVLFTCGDVIGDEATSKRIHNKSSLEILNILFALNVTIMLKFESFNSHQDLISNRRGYSLIRDNALRLITSVGFNRPNLTRLGFGIVLLKQNMNEIPKIYSYALENNIYPLVCPIMPVGKMKEKSSRDMLAPNINQVRLLTQKLVNIRRKYFPKINYQSDFPGGLPCDISRSGFYIDDTGNVFICEADEFIGNIKNYSLKELWEIISNRKWLKYYKNRRIGICNPKRNCGII